MYHSFLIHSSADGHLGCFHVLAMINSAAMNIGVHVSLSDLVSLVCVPRSGIAGSYGSMVHWEVPEGWGWGTHVNTWLIHVNVWQKSLQYCKVISLQLIKINEKKKKKTFASFITQDCVSWTWKQSFWNLITKDDGDLFPVPVGGLEAKRKGLTSS